MWEEYELTLHAAMELRNEEYTDLAAMKKMIASIKDEIRKLGDVNVNADRGLQGDLRSATGF